MRNIKPADTKNIDFRPVENNLWSISIQCINQAPYDFAVSELVEKNVG